MRSFILWIFSPQVAHDPYSPSTGNEPTAQLRILLVAHILKPPSFGDGLQIFVRAIPFIFIFEKKFSFINQHSKNLPQFR